MKSIIVFACVFIAVMVSARTQIVTVEDGIIKPAGLFNLSRGSDAARLTNSNATRWVDAGLNVWQVTNEFNAVLYAPEGVENVAAALRPPVGADNMRSFPFTDFGWACYYDSDFSAYFLKCADGSEGLWMSADNMTGNPEVDFPVTLLPDWSAKGNAVLMWHATGATFTNSVDKLATERAAQSIVDAALASSGPSGVQAGITNGLASIAIVFASTQGLASVASVNAATTGLVRASITNGLATTAFVASSTAGLSSSFTNSVLYVSGGSNYFWRWSADLQTYVNTGVAK